jgi:hypothetical protein
VLKSIFAPKGIVIGVNMISLHNERMVLHMQNQCA